MINMSIEHIDFHEKSPRNRQIADQLKIERKLIIKELKARGEFPRVLTYLDRVSIEAARERSFEEFCIKNPMAEV